MIVTGLRATLSIIGAGVLAEAAREYEPARAAAVAPACRVLILLQMAEWRRTDLYPRPETLGLQPHRN